LRGASAIEQILDRLAGKKLRVFVVWEPMLPTDWGKPKSGTLARVSDSRAAQFWDPDHLVAREIIRDDPPASVLPKPNCCEDGGIYWDMAIIYPPNAVWTAKSPTPLYRNGAVYQVVSEVEAKLREFTK
jgi:hypothetical protein